MSPPDRVSQPPHDVAALVAENAALREHNELLTAVLTHCPAVVFVKDTAGRLVLCNRAYDVLVGVESGALIGKTDHEIFGQATGDEIRARDAAICEGGAPQEVEELIPQADGVHTYMSIKFPVYDREGQLRGLAGIATDITERRNAELDRAALQEKVIALQRTALSELSTPIIPLAEGVIAVPLIGAIDGERARALMQALLEGISRHRSHTAILDVTGVRTADAQIAAALLQPAHAARLLGARVIITGVQPEVAQAMVELGADLGGIETLQTLQDGVSLALRRGRSR